MFIRKHLVGVAVTYNHSGVGDVVNKLVERHVLPTPDKVREELSFERDASRRPIGTITDAWVGPDGADWCSFTLDAGPGSNIAYLIKEGFLRGISLTHIAGAQAVPIEASLCKTPARPGCSIRHIAPTAFGAARYKGLVQRGLIPSTMETPSSVDSALEIISGLEADKRKVVEEAFLNNHRLVQASKKDAQTAQDRAKTLEEELAKQSKVYDADIGVMKAEIEAFANTIDAVLKDRPELSGKLVACKDLGDTLSGLPLGLFLPAPVTTSVFNIYYALSIFNSYLLSDILGCLLSGRYPTRSRQPRRMCVQSHAGYARVCIGRR